MSGLFVVTGSSRGVGLEICRILLDRSYRVIGLSRTPGPLKGLDGFEWCECNLSEVDQVRYAAEQIDNMVDHHLNGLILNASIGYYGLALEMGTIKLEKVVVQNFINQILLLRLLFPLICERSELFYVSTSASRIPAPMMAAYAATKVALESFIQSLAMECRFRVHIVRPAEIDTDFSRAIGVPPEAESVRNKLSTRTVAEKTLKMLNTNKMYSNIGYRARLIDLVVRFCPSLLHRRPSIHTKYLKTR